MMYGYARTSTTDQAAGLEAQIRDLEFVLCDEVIVEQASAVGDRPKFDALLAKLKRGDFVVVTKLDRLARSVVHLAEIVKSLEVRHASLKVLNLGIDTSTPTGKLMVNLLGSIAQFERELMLERQREGIARAKREGKYSGRLPRVDHGEVKVFVNRHEHEVGKMIAVRRAAKAFPLSERQIHRIVNGK